MIASVVVTSFTAHSAYASEVGRSTPAVGVFAGKLQNAQGDVVAFIEANETSGVEQKVAKRNQLDLQRSFLSDEQKEQQANADGRSQAQKAQQTAESLFTQLKSLDPEATKIYTTSYTISGVAVKANAAALRKLSEESDRIVHISPITEWAPLEEPKNAVTLDGDQQPQNKNSDALVGAIKAWNQTGKAGRGVNMAVVDTGLDYTHADFGESGNPADYATALSRTSNPLTDPVLVNKLDTAKYKGGYDFAGPTYDGRTNMIAQPDENPIDGHGGHHGTHVAGTVAGYGVKGDGNRFTGSYKDITAADIDDMRIGPGSTPDHADSECQLDIVLFSLIDKVPPQTAIDELLSIDKNPYTPDSSAAFQAALEAAQRAITNPDSTQKDLDKARTDLIAARDALVKLPSSIVVQFVSRKLSMQS